MSLSYPKCCKDPLYVQAELSDEEFFSLLKPEYTEITKPACEKNFDEAWNAYFSALSKNLEKRTYFKIKEKDIIRNYVNSEFNEKEISEALGIANDLTNYRFKLQDDEPFVFSKGNIPWNDDFGNSSYNRLFLTYMSYMAHLANAYIITRDSKYCVFFVDAVNNFIDTCPVPRGDNFTKDSSTWTMLGVALRLNAIMNNVAVMFDDECFNVEDKKRIIKHLYQTAQYVRKYHAANGNHVVVQMAALIGAAAFFEELEEADEWLTYGLARLKRELDEGVFSDGVQAEASPNYHVFVLNELILLKALQLSGFDKIPAELEETIHNMFVALRDMCTPEVHLLNLGDTSVGVSAEKNLKLAAYLYPGEFIFNENVNLSLATVCKFGSIVTGYNQKSQVNIPNFTAHTQSGFLSYRSDFTKNADYMFMHAGEGINGHSHADTLTVTLFANGRNILVDTGNAPYDWNKDRRYALSTSAHNTVKVDGEDSHVRMLHWLPMRTAPCKIWVCEETDDYVLFFASHYGYHRYMDPVVHTRKLIYVKDGGYFVVLDLMNAEKSHSYEVFFHLPPSETVFDESTKSVHTCFEDANVIIYPASSEENEFKVTNTAYHPNHNSKLVKPTYVISSKAEGNKYFATLIVPFNKEVPQISVKTKAAYKDNNKLCSFDATVLEININNKVQTIAINNLSIDPREYVNHEGNPDSDAHMKGKKNSVSIKVQETEFNDEVKIF
ncbi:MAG: alginate lyase family protein [Clostridia bacterium]|nr:alginate lyase family protein [Clostridia bacterium]